MSLSWPPCCKNTVSGACPPCKLVTMSVNWAGTPRSAKAVCLAEMPILSSEFAPTPPAAFAASSSFLSAAILGARAALSKPLISALICSASDADLPAVATWTAARLTAASIFLTSRSEDVPRSVNDCVNSLTACFAGSSPVLTREASTVTPS